MDSMVSHDLNETFSSRKRKEIPLLSEGIAGTVQLESSKRMMILAGYLAEEFLTKGTVCGEKCDAALSPEAKRRNRNRFGLIRPERNVYRPPSAMTYADMTTTLEQDGAPIPGMINLTQLGLRLQRLEI